MIINKPFPQPKPLQELNYLSFAEERLQLGYDYGAVGGPVFKTDITEVADEREQRNIPRWLTLGRWQLGNRLVVDSETDKLEEISYLRQFHDARLGSFQGFRFKDWADHKGENQYIATGDGVKTEFQLKKAYKAGNAVTYRPIQKPVVDTVDILVDGVNVAVDPNHEWVVNHETGVLSNPVPLTEGAILTANFEFDVPVWFESDQIGFRLEGYEPDTEATLYRLESVFVVEGRIPLTLPWQINQLPEITQDLDLGIVYDTIEQYQFATNKLALASGYTRKESKRADTKIIFNLGERNYNRAEVDQILGYFYCARGKAGEFPFVNLGRNYKVRFDQDQLNFKFEVASDTDALFSLSGLKIQVEEEIILRIPTLPGFLLNSQSFDVSSVDGLSPTHIDLQTNNYSTTGGGGNNSDNTSGTSNGFAGSFGSMGVSLENEEGLSGYYPFLAHVWGEFNGVPFAIGSLQTFPTNSSPKWLCFASISDPFSGQFTVSKLGNFYIEMYNVGRIKGLVNKDGKFIAIAPVFDLDDGIHKAICIEVFGSSSYNYTTTPILSSGNFFSSPEFYVDEGHIHVITSGSSTFRFSDFLSPSGLTVTENFRSNVTLKSGISTGNGILIYPVALSGNSSFREGGNADKEGYQGAVRVLGGGENIQFQILQGDPINNFITSFEIASEAGANVINKIKRPDSGDGREDMLVYDCYAVTDSDFPHTNLSKPDPAERFYLSFLKSGDNWDLLGSWKYDNLEGIGNPNQIFSSSGNIATLHKGIHFNSQKWLVDLNTGAINKLENLVPGFNMAIASVTSSPDYILIYGNNNGQNTLGFLGIDN